MRSWLSKVLIMFISKWTKLAVFIVFIHPSLFVAKWVRPIPPLPPSLQIPCDLDSLSLLPIFLPPSLKLYMAKFSLIHNVHIQSLPLNLYMEFSSYIPQFRPFYCRIQVNPTLSVYPSYFLRCWKPIRTL